MPSDKEKAVDLMWPAVAIGLAMAQGRTNCSRYSHELLMEFDKQGALGEKVFDNVSNIAKYFNSLGSSYFLSSLTTLMANEILVIDADKLHKFTKEKEDE